jgi:hypothetical protein
VTCTSEGHGISAVDPRSAPEGTTVADLLRAHVLILNLLGGYSDWMRAIGTQVSGWFADQWRHKAAFPTALLTPRLTVPSLLAACDAIDKDGLRKTARIVLAAVPTTNLRFAAVTPSVVFHYRAVSLLLSTLRRPVR